MTSPLYYAVLIALLAVLVVVLVLLIRKRKKDAEAMRAYQEYLDKLRAERQAEEEKKQPNWRFWGQNTNGEEQQGTKWRHGRQYTDDDRYIPKYAAGDEMDSLRRKPNPKNETFTPVIIAAIGLFCAIAYALHSTSGNPSPVITQPQASEKLNMEILSTETNQERTKIYVTLHYENESVTPCYNIVTTVTLTYGDVIADTVEHTISTMAGNQEEEEIVTLSIPEEYRNEAYYVNAKTNYKWKIP